MPKYLFEASYTQEGIRGLLKEGGSSRQVEVEKLFKGLGGKLETFYYTFGDKDVFAIADLPDASAAAAASLTISATGTIQVRTIPLLTPKEIDQASHESVDFRPPGLIDTEEDDLVPPGTPT